MAFCGRMFRELFQIVHFKSEVRKIGADHYRPALIEFTNLNLLVALGCFQKHKLRSATGSVTAKLLESQHILVERNRFLQVEDAIAVVQQYPNHGLYLSSGPWIQTLYLDDAFK